MNPRVKVGVFGVGALGQHHARIYASLPAAELVGVYDVNAARAAEVALRHGTRPFGRIDELAGLIEAASVVVPTDRHHEVFTALAERGLHMLVEKPIAATADEADGMVRAAAGKALILQVGHVERFNPVIRFLDQHLTQPLFVEASRLAPYPPPREGAVPRGTEVSVVLDLMIHDLEIILHLVRSPLKEIHAAGIAVLSPSEDIANVRLSFENGCVANVTASRVSQDRLREIRVYQADSYLSLDYMNQSGRIHRKAGGRIEIAEAPIDKGEPLVLELSSFIECVRTRGRPVVGGEEGAAALKLALDVCRHIAEKPS